MKRTDLSGDCLKLWWGLRGKEQHHYLSDTTNLHQNWVTAAIGEGEIQTPEQISSSSLFSNFLNCFIRVRVCVWVQKDWRRMSKIYYTKQGGGVNLEIWPSVTISGQAALQTPPSLPPTHPPSKTWVREQIFYKQKTNLRFSFDLPV